MTEKFNTIYGEGVEQVLSEKCKRKWKEHLSIKWRLRGWVFGTLMASGATAYCVSELIGYLRFNTLRLVYVDHLRQGSESCRGGDCLSHDDTVRENGVQAPIFLWRTIKTPAVASWSHYLP